MGRRRLDLINQRFGKLIVIKEAGMKKGYALYLCQCDCGKQKIVQGRLLVQGKTKSCGCLNHGDTIPKRTKEYISWQRMKDRCLNSNSDRFRNYGGRGITICERWLNDYGNFLIDMGRCPVSMSLHRINNNGNYEPNNCKWAGKKEQANNRRDSVLFEYDGITLNQTDWANKLGVSHTTIQRHLTKGEAIEDIIRYFDDLERTSTAP